MVYAVKGGRRLGRIILWLSCLACTGHCGVGRLHAGTFSWNGLGNGTWGDGADWVGSVAPTGALTDDLVFSSAAAAGNRTAANTLSNATVDSITFAASNYILSQNAITLGSTSIANSGSIILNSGAANNLISFDVQLGVGAGGQQFFTVNSGADLTMSGQISGSTGAQLNKGGTGTLTLGGDNSGYTGPIVVTGGVLRIGHANALGDTSNGTTVNANSQLQVTNVSGAINENLTLNGAGVASDGALLNANGSNTWAGNVLLDSNSSIGASVGTTLNISGQISDTGAGHNLTKEGAGRVVLSNTAGNTYRGSTTINNGTLSVNNTSGSGTGSGSVLVTGSASGHGTLGGTGVISGAVTLGGPVANSNGFIAPGNGGAGTLTVSSLLWNGGNQMNFDLGATQGTSDVLELSTGSLSKGSAGTFNFFFTDLGITPGMTYSLIKLDAASTTANSDFVAGDFSFSSNNPNLQGTFSELLAGNGHVQAVQFQVTNVPEPSGLILTGLGFLGVLFRRRRQNQNAGRCH
jgi:autotransporter-associated beta strand protein